MCGIGGVFSLKLEKIPALKRTLEIINKLQAHRGPDEKQIWEHPSQNVGFSHARLSIIDLKTGNQPMKDAGGNWVTYNGEIYNFEELRQTLGSNQFKTNSDTEVILHAYRKWGVDCVKQFRGMFAFALWDEQKQALFCARDRFGIKPFYYTVTDGKFYFASEVKALLPFIHSIQTDLEGFKDYLTFQFCLAGKTLFAGIHELLPADTLFISNGNLTTQHYWQVYYDLDFKHTEPYFEEEVRQRLSSSIELHLKSDVPVGSYVSGGLDSGAVASRASEFYKNFAGFHGKFSFDKSYDESEYAQALARFRNIELHEINITAKDFIDNIRQVIYHLDFPTAGPGSFAQFMVSKLARQHRKVALSGVGGDETFGGYTRYLIAYFEQCIKAAIDGTMNNGNFIVTYESIIPNLTALQNYKPLLKEFWREGLFDEMDQRYFRLINRSNVLSDEIRWSELGSYSPFETFEGIFKAANVKKESYFDSMTHFDFKTLLPALLHVEDRVSMAHGLESRVPFLDHPLVELAATIPSNIKFQNGTLKHIFRKAVRPWLPDSIMERKDKMGFPVPLNEWMRSEIKDFVYDTLGSSKALSRSLIDNRKVRLEDEPKFGRKVWGLLCLELWQQEFHDKESQFKSLLKKEVTV